MNKNVIYIVGATVLLGGGAYLFLKNKKAKDLSKLAELGGATTGGATTGGATTGGTTTGGATTGGTKPPLSTVSDGVSPSDANLNLANATLLASKRKDLVAKTKPNLSLSSGGNMFGGGLFGGGFIGGSQGQIGAMSQGSIQLAKKQLEELDKKLADLGYKVDAIGQLVKI
jgi:hypothetical protein